MDMTATPDKTGCCSQTATNAQHRANNPGGHTPVLPQQIAHRATHGETGCFLLAVPFFTIISFLGERKHDLQMPLKTGCYSQTATKAQHRANNLDGYTPVFAQQFAHGATRGETGEKNTFHSATGVFSNERNCFSLFGVANFEQPYRSVFTIHYVYSKKGVCYRQI